MLFYAFLIMAFLKILELVISYYSHKARNRSETWKQTVISQERSGS